MHKRNYSAAFRIKAVSLADDIGYSRAEAILGVSRRTLHIWKKLPVSGETMKKEIDPELKAALLEATAAQRELKQLKKENEELKTANLILKEIASVFSKDPLSTSLGWSLNSRNETKK